MFYKIILCITLIQPIFALCEPGDAQNTQENCNHVENSQTSFNDSADFCSNRHGVLASVHNAFDLTSLRKLASGCDYFWLGGYCTNGNCVWLDGTKFDYKNFKNGPSTGCIVAETKGGAWSTEECSRLHCTACEVKGAAMNDCQDWLNNGYTDSGKYTILVNGKEREVFCDMKTYGGGWTLFQNRVDESDSFWDHTWAEYKNGFGGEPGINSNYWLGNDALHEITSRKNATLRIELYEDRTPNAKYPNAFWWGHYFNFVIGPEEKNYALNIYMDWSNIVGNSSTAWYDITYSDGSPFSTIDRINDRKECVTQFKMGGWWLHNCALSSLNGVYTPDDWNNGYGLFWIVDGSDTVIHPKRTKMLIRNSVSDTPN
ncbi:unnamed protein product [Caenorhabditis bovis]|uniref:Fibrinogen C-terminal domain-containing protein n=1 Tax=Caenorhabditis bovis TaxID=2654633 RepID=A0A8S1EMM7_9PELO|nr:unnamed protein product [Caenorhabditis bovis]